MEPRKPAFGGLSRSDEEFLAAALVGFEYRRSEIEAKMAELRRQLGGRGTRDGNAPISEAAPAAAPKKRKMSEAARKRIAAAQHKRWAEYLEAKKAAGKS
jgi:hypothetical protein